MRKAALATSDRMASFHPLVREWFLSSFEAPTRAQEQAWPPIQSGSSTLLLAPTGSGKTLAAFLVAIDRLVFGPPPAHPGVRVLYISPLKALGVDVDRNLRSPLDGVRTLADARGIAHRAPLVAVRSGDTPSDERRRLARNPPDILITTPESLYLLLTSRARETLTTVDTVIVDEIHSLVGNKRGSHLFLSLERLERLRRRAREAATSLQRIGLSATQRPLDEIARLLGGGEAGGGPEQSVRPRPVEIIDAGARRFLDLSIEVPIEDMARPGDRETTENGDATASIPSIWPSIHPRLVELIRGHKSTMIFVNSRRLAERLATAINELAGEELALAHHGSIARETRIAIEDRLKKGELPAIVATSSLELGIDMGAVDLVIQIEAPPSIASGIQRIGRAGHHVGGRSEGVIFPKYRGDLLACAAAAERMLSAEVEETFYPRNSLDVLAQQIAAMVAMEPLSRNEIATVVRGAAPFFELPDSSLEGVLDLLAGRYPSDDFSLLRPRLVWDRHKDELTARSGTRSVAVINGGTIPDRGLYGVFVSDGNGPGSRVGELDEEMVFETRAGDVFLLGATAWRVIEVTHDRVLVAPAPGEPGRMPFWKGDGPGRPLEFGKAIGALARRISALPRAEAEETLARQNALDSLAARNLVDYLEAQKEATGEVPGDRTIVVETFLDEVGDWRCLVLSPFGARIHAPWAIAVAGHLRVEGVRDVDMVYSDNGIVFRLPDTGEPPDPFDLVPRADEVEDLVVRELGGTALFAGRFRENAARALLLPRRRPGQRSPLWLQRRRSADLLAAASRHADFPIVLETYRECLRDVFDLPGLVSLLRECERGAIRIHPAQTTSASPFASSLLFNYVASYLYEGDAPLAERRAVALSLDHAQLRELLGDAELRDLLDPQVIEETARELQRLTSRYPPRDPDGVHDLLRHLGDLTREEIRARRGVEEPSPAIDAWLTRLLETRRALEVRIAGESRIIAAEDAARYRDALGIALPPGLPDAYLGREENALRDLVSRHARTHIPFRPEEVAARLGTGVAPVLAALRELQRDDRVVEGELLPRGSCREFCHVDVLRTIKRRSLARIRAEIEPVETEALCRFLISWHGIGRGRRGLDALLDALEQLQGLALSLSSLERDILPARVEGFRPGDLDELLAAGEIVWHGFPSRSAEEQRIALYLADHASLLSPAPIPITDELALRVLDHISSRGAVRFEDIVTGIGGYPGDVLGALLELVRGGYVTNDTLAPIRSLQSSDRTRDRRRGGSRPFRSRRATSRPGSEGRWSLFHRSASTPTERLTALAEQLVARYGILTREMVLAEGVSGGFASIYPVLRALEERGKLRRGQFVAGQGAAQFARRGAENGLRSFSGDDEGRGEVILLDATDPASPHGAALKWPTTRNDARRPRRAPGARVLLQRGQLLAYLFPRGRHLLLFPGRDADAGAPHEAIARALAGQARPGRPVFLSRIDGEAPGASPLASHLRAHGFVVTSRGYLHRGGDRESVR